MGRFSCVGWMAAVSLACLALPVEGFAQHRFELGLKGGAGFSKLSGSGLEQVSNISGSLGGGYTMSGTVSEGLGDVKTGFVGGAYAAYQANERFGLRLEALYAMKGGKGDISGSADVFDPANNFLGTVALSGTNTLSLDYFEFPLLGVVSFPTGSSGTLHLFAGPSVAVKIRAEAKTEITASANGASQTESATQDMGDTVNGTDFGGVLGADMTYRMTRSFLFVDARWAPGLKEIDKTGSVDWKNNTFGLMLGFGIPLAGGK